MDFLYKNARISLESEKRTIELQDQSIVLDGMTIDMAGEYEKSGCLMYVWQKDDVRLYHFRVEGYWIVYIPTLLTDISPEALDFLGTLDILIMPGAKSLQSVIEKIEPRLLVTYGEGAHEIGVVLGYADAPVSKYRLRDADLSSEKTGCVVMGE